MRSWRHKRPGYNVQVRMWGHCHALQVINASDSQMSMTNADECQLTGSRAAQPSQPARLMPCPFSAQALPSGLPRTSTTISPILRPFFLTKRLTQLLLSYFIVLWSGKAGRIRTPIRDWTLHVFGDRLKSGQDLIIFGDKSTWLSHHWSLEF